MTEARDAIFARLRRALAREGIDPATRERLDRCLASPSRGPQPALSNDRVAQFIAKADAAASTVARADSPAAVVRIVQEYLTTHALEPSLVMAPASELASLAWPKDIHVERRAALADDTSALTAAFAGVAETGSLVLLSGPQTPTSLNFLPENYVCLLSQCRIVSHTEDVWSLLREEYESLPRALNFITGPSRTADVEQAIQLGAHGPRRVLIILIDDWG